MEETISVSTIPALIQDVTALREAVLSAEARHKALLNSVLAHHVESARNLIHYVEVRSHDLRDLQERLSDVGMSSLGRMEAGVLGHLETVLSALHAQAGGVPPEPGDLEDLNTPLTPAQGRQILEDNADRLLGPERSNRRQRIMVTMPTEAADDQELVGAMVEAGMDLARINCAHDHEETWGAMIKAIRTQNTPAGRAPLIAMDLAGPKLRTGPLELGPKVIKIRPRRDNGGHVIAPALVALGEIDSKEVDDTLPLAGDEAAIQEIIKSLRVGDTLHLTDNRGSNRTLIVEDIAQNGLVVSARQTIYWATGSKVSTDHGTLVIGELPEVEQSIRVHTGDEIVLTRSMEPRPAATESPFLIGCSLPEPFQSIADGDRVLFDDGKIAATVTRHSDDEMWVSVEEAAPNGSKLKAGKGINFPDTDLDITALTEDDRSHLQFVAQYADMVNMSFVHGPRDVAELIDALEAENGQHVDITLKIETVEAFEQLPRMLLEAMRWDNIGVMIARGDLAVEAGFARMAELQEEILWLCEAAHVPAIWATQVLESLAKSGLPSRAEVTDAARAQRAESVMLNKGPFITDAITELSDILHRMGSHADKKRDMLRELHSWDLTDPSSYSSAIPSPNL